METILYTDCPACLSQMGQECRWIAATHPRFHAERVAAAKVADVPNVVDLMSKASVDKAFQDAIDDVV